MVSGFAVPWLRCDARTCRALNRKDHAKVAKDEGPPAGPVSDAGVHTGGLNGTMAHHGAAAVASIALPAEHVFAQLRAISVRTKALEIHTQGNRAAQIHVAAILECLRGLLEELSDTAFLAELAARQTKALLRVINAAPHLEDPHG